MKILLLALTLSLTAQAQTVTPPEGSSLKPIEESTFSDPSLDPKNSTQVQEKRPELEVSQGDTGTFFIREKKEK